MKRILITGANSYIGTSVEKYLAAWPDSYQVESLDVRESSWKTFDFSGFDSVFHVAAIVHVNTKKLTNQLRDSYAYVNTVLPVEIANRAKTAGASQFIFLSTMGVYGENGGIKRPVLITAATLPSPNTLYGKSKLDAEQALTFLVSNRFALAILRPPMVYGQGAKGNYQGLVKAAKLLPVFPDFDNQRSMLHIDGLSAFVKKLIDDQASGLFFPQDERYLSTTQMVRDLARDMGTKVRFTRMFNPFLRLLSGRVGLVDKVFGDLKYEQTMALASTSFPIQASAPVIPDGNEAEQPKVR